ncbi:MAG TPA: hypothetical protein VFB06_02795 [Streptosporangiaceae bacterium]|nr:hypothetical protein [Streptosporangiaceae bacterium]
MESDSDHSTPSPGDEWLSTANFIYYFWLPAGKDEFGFAKQDDAPLAGSVSYRDVREWTIAKTFPERTNWLAVRHNGSVGGMKISGSLAAQDGELGLRKLHFPFRYEPSEAILSGIVKSGPIHGTAIILSNGLYLWSFKVWYDREKSTKENVKKAVKDFVKDDFVPNCIGLLFGFHHQPQPETLTNEYDGILTYYQLDLLFNGLFDMDAHPKKFFDRGDVQPFMIGDIIRSASLYGFDQEYGPLWDMRKDYSQHGAIDARNPKVDTNMDLTAKHLRDTGKAQEQREIFLSKLSFSAMEQFIQVTLPFGIENYKAGLDHCRLGLAENALMLRRNQAASDYRRPSLNSAVSATDIEAYFLLLRAKLPTLTFFRDLVEDIIEVTHPLHLIPDKRKEWYSRRGWAEWRESLNTLREAEDQLSRQVDAIRTDVEAIQVFLTMSQSDAVLSELAESRKLNEIEVEDPRRAVTLATRDWEQLTYLLAILAVILAAFQSYSGLGLWFTDVLLHNDLAAAHTPWWHVLLAVGQWFVIALLLFLYYWFRFGRQRRAQRRGTQRKFTWKAIKRKLRKGKPSKTARRPDDNVEENEVGELDKDDARLLQPVRLVPNIFDCTFPRENMSGEGIEELVSSIRVHGLIDVCSRDKMVKLASVATFRDIQPGTAERVKYSLESSPNRKGVSYTLHVEVDIQPRTGTQSREAEGRSDESRKQSEQLRNVRLVVRIPVEETVPIDGVRHVVQQYASRLILKSPESGTVREYFQRRFGWYVS